MTEPKRFVCTYCSFVTQKRQGLEKHNKTKKHQRNTHQVYIEPEDELIRKAIAKEERKKFLKKEDKLVLDL